ncbi:Hypothetical protein GbCGDNIH2_0628 [Granulibacter bethesdensis]|nr:Hypothetical protein GbCGDNIH2_0628 [Granulibacter bethesdensis]
MQPACEFSLQSLMHGAGALDAGYAVESVRDQCHFEMCFARAGWASALMTESGMACMASTVILHIEMYRGKAGA